MLALVALVVGQSASGGAPIVMDGAVPLGSDDYFDLTFEVPAGTKEIQIAHLPKDDGDVLDWGVYEPDGSFRGWGGGNKEDAIIGELASSRSYLPGPLPAGTWTLDVGKARLTSASPGYHVEITLRTEPTLPPATDRTPYREAPPFRDKPGFYAGDFHTHSEDSGDARPAIDEMAQYAIGRGLDFFVVTDHNTDAQVDRLVDAQERNPEILILPGMEFTTYGGHATAFGATKYVDHRIGHNGRTVQAAIDELVDGQGALFSINHPVLDIGTICIGCAWKHGDPRVGSFHGVEIETGAYSEGGFLFADRAIQFWESLLDEGNHLAALGGSDDHQAGKGSKQGMGSPCVMVYASKLSQDAIKQAVLDSRTVVKLEDCNAPMVGLETDPPRTGDTAIGDTVTLTATVTHGKGSTFKFVQNGVVSGDPLPVTKDPQVFTMTQTADATGKQRIRGEVDDAGDGHPLTVTSYVWLKAAPSGCASTSSSWSLTPLFALLLLLRLRSLPVPLTAAGRRAFRARPPRS